MADLGLLAIFAHPDDEGIIGGTLAKYGAEGVRTGLICATRGEVGEISDPALATPETLGAVREKELENALVPLGVKSLWWLDYRDSGMVGTPENADRRNLHNADSTEVTQKIVKIIREFKPQVIITFDPLGAYGHPDHIAIYRLATAAFQAAADPQSYPAVGQPWPTDRLFHASFSRSFIRQIGEFVIANNIQTGFRSMNTDTLGLPDEMITNTIDVSRFQDAKDTSWQAHATQHSPDSLFEKLPEAMVRKWRNIEVYVLAEGTPLPTGAESRGDLFAGLR